MYPSCIGKHVTGLTPAEAKKVWAKRESIKTIRQKIRDLPAATPDRAAKTQVLLKEIADEQKAIDKVFYDHAHTMVDVVDDKLEKITNLAEQIVDQSSLARNYTNEAMKT